MDYKRKGKYFIHFDSPPKPPTKDEVKLYGASVLEVIDDKVEELARRIAELNEYKTICTEALDTAVESGMDADTEYFFRVLVATNYSEIVFAQKWINYWLNVYKLITGVGKKSEELNIEGAKRVPIETLCVQELKPAGAKQLKGCCPFHEEKTPSFIIYQDDNHFHCYGCGAHGDSIEFLIKRDNLTFIEAIEELT